MSAPAADDVREEIGHDERAWMITFADLISLLLTFMVMLFAMSDATDRPAAAARVDRLEETVAWTGRVAGTAAGGASDRRPTGDAGELDYLAALLASVGTTEPALAGLRVERRDDRLVVAAEDGDWFPPGLSALAPPAQPVLAALAGVVAGFPGSVRVVGHARTRETAAGDDAWRLAIERAQAAAAELTSAGMGEIDGCWGLAEADDDALGESSTASRSSQGRYVEFVVSTGAGDGR